ncbi:MAG TPA: sigma-70 family RNA polymerase sigma factor [Chryseosolibacter sp.]|nr:sigma-70 family RNA polymerase sigma factor [Chryseosolibacter sp.]
MPANKSLTDEQLVTLLQQGSAEAFEEIYHRHWLSVYRRFYKKLQSKTLAEEYTQELFTSLWSRRKELAINNCLVHYLNGAIRKMVINNIRVEIREKLLLQRAQEEPVESPVYNEDDLSNLQTALNNLPGKTGDIIKLSKLQGRAVKDIAQQHNISNKAVEYHITKALKMLRAYIKDLRNAAASLVL